MTGQRIGYVRVSTLDQSTARQLEGVSVFKVFEDIASGKDAKRPALDAMIDFAREGDTVVVHSMDRLARNLDDLRAIVRRLTNKKVRVEFVKEQLTFTGEDAVLADRIRTVQDPAQCGDAAYGAPRLTAELNERVPEWQRVNRKRVARVMR